MKISHVILRPRYSGAEVLARDLALRQKASGLDLSIVAVEPCERSFRVEVERLRQAGIWLYSPTRANGGALNRTRYLRKTLASIRPDLVIAHSILPSLYSRFGKLLGLRYRLATVLHSNSDFGDPALRFAERTLRELTDTLICVSHEAARAYKQQITANCNPIIIPNGIDLGHFKFDPRIRAKARRESLHVEDNTLIILQIGRICEQKQQILTLSAVRSISEQLKKMPVELLFVGTTEAGKYSDDFQRRMSDSYGTVKVKFLGPRSDIANLLAAADLCVMPSAWEAHPIAALEAAASGIAVIVSDIPAFKDLLRQDGVRSFQSGNYDSLANMIYGALRSQDKERSIRNLSDYSIEKCVKEYSYHLNLPQPTASKSTFSATKASSR